MASLDLGESLMVEVAPGRLATGDLPATGPTYRNVAAKDGFATVDGVTTLYEMFERSVAKFADSKCLGWRPVLDGVAQPYKWMTYKEVSEKVATFASGLKAVGLQAKGRVGVFGGNCPEWMIVMQACNRTSGYCVPLYDTLGENAIEYILGHSEASVVVVAADKIRNLAAALATNKEHVETVVYWGTAAPEHVATIEGLGIGVYSYEAFQALGASKPSEPTQPAAEDYCTIMYTSGTTGDPKGVLLTHRSVVSTVAALIKFLDQVKSNLGIHGGLGPNDSMLSYLPLAHIFDRSAEESFLSLGSCIGYWRGDIKGLVDDIAALKPTVFIGVPRVFDRIYTGIVSKIKEAGGLKAFLFNWGFNRKLHFLQEGVPSAKASPFFDKLVFSKVKERLGGRVRLIVTGGAPLARHVEDFLKVTMCAPVIQGYGLSETCAASFIAVPDRPEQSGTVGPAMPCIELRLEGVPEMKYDSNASPPRGEVCLRGPSLFSGYYKDATKTAEDVDAEGWFHTGDVGELTPQGALKIIDRKKNIFKLSQGEYVAVEKVEAVYKKNSAVEQIWVYGNSLESVLVAVVVPEETKLKSWAATNGMAGSVAEVCASPAARKHYLAELTATAREGKLKGFEIFKAVHLEPVQFSVENDLMTPTFKLKRPQLLKHYQLLVDEMYNAVRN